VSVRGGLSNVKDVHHVQAPVLSAFPPICKFRLFFRLKILGSWFLIFFACEEGCV